MLWFLLQLWLIACLISLLVVAFTSLFGQRKPRDPAISQHAEIGDRIQRQFYH